MKRGVLGARAVAVAALPVIVVLGLSARAVMSGLPPKVAGDALYTVLVDALVIAVRPRLRPATAGAIALGFSYAIELAQLTPWPAWLSSKHALLRLAFGTTFGVIDLVGYTIGAAAAIAIHAGLRAAARRRLLR